MEYNYKGIKPESIELLCLNRFNDSKPFYEEHKEELKQGITVPLRQMVLDIPVFTEIQGAIALKSSTEKICGCSSEDIKKNIRLHLFIILNFIRIVTATVLFFGLGKQVILGLFIK